MIHQKWLIHISLFISSVILLFSFQNCGLNLSQKSFGEFKIDQMSTYQGSVCEEELFNEFKKPNGYHDFLKTNCSACHNGSNPNTPRFAHADSVIAFSKFFEKEIEGNGAISDRAISNHQPGYTGTKHQNIIDQLKTSLNTKIAEYHQCSGKKSDNKSFKTIPRKFGRLGIAGIDVDERIALNLFDDELEFQVQITKKLEDPYLIIKNPKMKKNHVDENGYVVMGMNILINGVVNKSMTMFRLVNESICSNDETRLMAANAHEMYVPVDGIFSPEDTIQFEFTEIVKENRNQLNCSTIENWSVFAGSTDRGDGLNGKNALLNGEGWASNFAINPMTGDIYASDYSMGIRKLDVQTGLVSTVIWQTPPSTTTNLKDNTGALPERIFLPIGNRANIIFDNQGRLYIGVAVNDSWNALIYQIDFKNKMYRKYVGGLGDGNSENVDPLNVQVVGGQFNFDDENNLYFWSNCPYDIPEVLNTDGTIKTAKRTVKAPQNASESIPSKKVILKVTQNEDGSAGNTVSVFGSCNSTLSTITSGANAVEQPPIAVSYVIYSPILPIEDGRRLFVNVHSLGSYKIIDGKVYKSNIVRPENETGFAWSRELKLAYRVQSSGISTINFNFTGDNQGTIATIENGDVQSTLITSKSIASNCSGDIVDSSQFCGLTGLRPLFFQNKLYFTDGTINNTPSNYRIRKLENNKISIVFGRNSFVGEGKIRQQIQGHFSGVYYKKSSEPNSEAFPAGLYFLDRTGILFGKIDEKTELTEVIWGNQSKIDVDYSRAVNLGNQSTMGSPYGGGSAWPLAFDKNGLPWFRTGSDLVTINQDKMLIRKTRTLSQSTQFLPLRYKGAHPADTVDPAKYGMHPYGGLTNLTLKDEGAFLLTTYVTSKSEFDPYLGIRFLDYGNKISPQIIGGTFLYDSQNARQPSSDESEAGQVVNRNLYSECRNSASLCYVFYDQIMDRLYLSEKNLFRYIQKPDNLSASTLVTVFTTDKEIRNFAITPNREQVWYIKDNGLFCFQLNQQQNDICDNRTDYFKAARITNSWSFANGANQLTFKDNKTLFLSTYHGLILKFNIPQPNITNTIPANVTFSDLIGSNIQLNAFAAKCMSCHFGTNALGGLDLSNYENSKAKMDRISTRIQATSSPMPPTSSPSLSPYEKQLILKWIQDGGPN